MHRGHSKGLAPLRLGGVLAICSFALGCGEKASSYDRLCKVYEEYAAQEPSSELAVKITQRVERELPEIYPTYVTVAQNSVEYRYEDFKELARTTADQHDWSCDAIRKFYASPAPTK